MADHWDFFFARVNDAPSSIFVNMGIRDSVPDRGRPRLAWIWIPLRQPRADGLSSGDEAPILNRIEDALVAALSTGIGAKLVGRITGAGRREFYFYAEREGPLEALISRALATEPGYTFDCGQQADPEWRQYLDVLYPSERDHEQMRNRRCVLALVEKGDISEAPRPIDHWCYFGSAEARDEAAVRLGRAGFAIIERPDAGDDHQPGLMFQRVGPATLDATDRTSVEIFDALEGLDAEYDGWAAPVMKDAASS